MAVTVLTAMLAAGQGLPPGRALLVTSAVLAGQLTIGWGNDLVDVRRDRAVGRRDKPLVTGEIAPRLVVVCLVAAAAACLALTVAAGWRSAAVHLGLVVLSGHAYNLRLKSTAFSWLPYCVAFGSLPAVVTLADVPPAAPPWWMIAVAAGLGVAAHFLNVLPDLGDDAATGVRGLPHRIGALPSRVAATGLLLGASGLAVVGSSLGGSWRGWSALAVAAVLAAVALAGKGRLPFQAAVAIALLDVALLVTANGTAGRA